MRTLRRDNFGFRKKSARSAQSSIAPGRCLPYRAICNVSDFGRNSMRYKLLTAAFAATVALPFAAPAGAADLEVTHWWTSGGEAAAVAELAKAFDATGNHWVDGAIAGGGSTARPVMVSRITGGS